MTEHLTINKIAKLNHVVCLTAKFLTTEFGELFSELNDR
jgi:hypothetical protein